MTTANAETSQPPARLAPRRAGFRPQLIKTARWLHIYLSMVSFAVVLFFSATGLTLNHPDWFCNAVRTSERHGTLPLTLLRPTPDTLALANALRHQEHLHGTTDDPRTDDTETTISFRAPGYTADTVINNTTGAYTVTETRNGTVAVLNDLHKGRDAGRAWSWLIDASAILLTLVSLTGLVILWFIYRRRTSGLLTAAAGLVVLVLLYRFLVP